MELFDSYFAVRQQACLKAHPASENNSQIKRHQVRETLMELVLYSLAQSNFFEKAALTGGTALRLFHDLDRFVCSMDFSAAGPDADFDIRPYIQVIQEQASAFGLSVKAVNPVKDKKSNDRDSFVDTDSMANTAAGAEASAGTEAVTGTDAIEFFLNFLPEEKSIVSMPADEPVSIGIRIDLNPPAGAVFEYKNRMLPGCYRIRVQDLLTLFAGKIHAILCKPRSEFSNGRDLYDYFFYMQTGTPVNLSFLQSALVQTRTSPASSSSALTIDWVKNTLKQKFRSIDFTAAKNDALPFVNDPESMDFWDPEIFCSITDRLKEYKAPE